LFAFIERLWTIQGGVCGAEIGHFCFRYETAFFFLMSGAGESGRLPLLYPNEEILRLETGGWRAGGIGGGMKLFPGTKTSPGGRDRQISIPLSNQKTPPVAPGGVWTFRTSGLP